MKKRIDALEVELKDRSAQRQTAESATKTPSPTSESAAISSGAPRAEGGSRAKDDPESESATAMSLALPQSKQDSAIEDDIERNGEGKTESSSLASAQMNSVAPQAEAAAPEKKKASEPFAFADFTWLNGTSREKDTPLDTKLFTPEFRADTSYIYDFNHPKDDTLVGSSESGRTQEVQLQQLGIGGDFHYDNVRGRVMTQFGMYSTMTPRNDASPARGQWDLSNAYRYLSEAYGGYHFNVLHGINVDAGIFMSYVGLFSYYNYDNWAYRPSYVSSNTPWFFNGVRVQIFPTEHLKIEPWFVNGWQSYGRFNTYREHRSSPRIPGIRSRDVSETFDYMPSQYITFRWEFDHRAASVPYFAGPGGVTPPGGDTGPPGSLVPGFTPDLRKTENPINLGLLVNF